MPDPHLDKTKLVAPDDASPAGDEALSALAARPDALIGQTLENKIVIEEFAAKGGMGSVYRARHLQLGTDVAVKVLAASFDEQAITRFRQEARVAFKLRHPNVCNVHDVGVTPDDRAYLVMDWLQGKSLSTLIAEQGALSSERAIALTLQICQGLSEAHKQGIIHRDIKPSNLIISKDGASEQARIIDFGIAKSVAGDHATTMTTTGEIVGSPTYMSPEQATGNRADQRSDIYSLGCVFFEMLTGEAPFRGDNPLQVLMKHANEQPPTLSQAANKTFAKELEAVVAHALEKDASKRYQTIEQLHDDLLRIQQGAPLIHANEHRMASGRKLLLGCIVATLIAIGAAGVFILLQPPAREVSLDGPADTAAKQKVAAELRSIQQAASHFNSLGDAEKPAAARRLLAICDQMLLQVQAKIGIHAAPYLTVLAWKAEALRYIDLDQAAAVLKRIVDLAPNNSLWQADAYERLAYISKTRNDFGGAADYYLKALPFYQGRAKVDPQGESKLYEHLGDAYQHLEKYDEAIDWYRKALNIDEKLGGLLNAHMPYDAAGLATCYAKKGDLKESAKWAEMACDGFHRQNQPQLQKQMLNELRDLYVKTNDAAGLSKTEQRLTEFNTTIEALIESVKQLSAVASGTSSAADARAAIVKYRELMPLIKARYQGDPKYAEYMQDYGKLLRLAGSCHEAEAVLQDVITIQSKDYGADSEVTASAVEELGLSYLSDADYRNAEQTLKRATTIYSSSRGADSPEVARCMMQLGNAYNKQRMPEEALIWFQWSIPHSQAHKTSAAAYDFAGMASSYKMLDQPRKAIEAQQKAVDEFAKLNMPGEQAAALQQLIELYSAVGDRRGSDSAKEQLRKLQADK